MSYIDPDQVFHEKEALFVEYQVDMQLIGPVVDFARRVARNVEHRCGESV